MAFRFCEKALEFRILNQQPPRTVRWIGYPLALLAMFALVGGHWAVLQTVAWAGMIQTYTRTDGLAGGLEKTFSGNYPCKMCVKVQDEKKQEEQKLPLLKTEKKAEVLFEPVRLSLGEFSLSAQGWPRPVADLMPSHRDEPSSPPPRTLSRSNC